LLLSHSCSNRFQQSVCVKILVLNSGSSSLKFKLFSFADTGPESLASGLVERIGEKESRVALRRAGPAGRKLDERLEIGDHAQAVAVMLNVIRDGGLLQGAAAPDAIGHRVVHGGETFHSPVRIDEGVIRAIEELGPLAPLHNPVNLIGIRATRERAPEVPQVAVFDTGFHQSLPRHAYLYGLPYVLYEREGVRRYGFHGTSHNFVCRAAAEFLGRTRTDLNMITLHLGNGASAAAIRKGRSVDTSMGMTPLEGLLMGTRCGDLDPAVLLYLVRHCGMDIEQIDMLLNRKSGLKGICGQNDMRAIVDRAGQGDDRAILALQMFTYRLKKYVGSYMAVLGRVDCLVFTGGIGEHAPSVRELACQDLEGLGIVLDRKRNSQALGGTIREIQAGTSRVRILVVPTDEELEIARQTAKVLGWPEVPDRSRP